MKPFEQKKDVDSDILAAVNEALSSDPKLNYFLDTTIVDALARSDEFKYIELTPGNVRAGIAKVLEVDFDRDRFNGHAGGFIK